jgi:hypothetical protein
VDAEAAETYLRVLAETQLRHFRAPGFPNWDGIRELRYVGVALAALGVLDMSVAEDIAAELDAVVQVRIRRSGAGPARPVFSVPPTAPSTPSAAVMPTAPAAPPGPPGPAGPAAGPPAMTPAGQVLRLGNGPGAPRLRLLSVTRTQRQTEITVAGRVGRQWTGQGFHHAVRDLSAVDDAGSAFTVQHSGGSSDGLLTLVPAVPAGARWVEICRRPDGPATRVDLTAPATPAEVVTEPLEPASPGEQLLDAVAGDILAEQHGAPGRHVGLDLVVTALRDAGQLPPDSAAAGRLAVLCQRTGLRGGRGLATALAAGQVRPAALPEPWTSVLGYFSAPRPAGSLGIAPVAVALPEVDGVRFALTGLSTEAEQTTLRVLAWGLPPRLAASPAAFPSLLPWFPWWARDSTGQWHVTADHGSSSHGGRRALTLRMVPPVSRSVTSLELIIAGLASRLRVTLPLAWQENT